MVVPAVLAAVGKQALEVAAQEVATEVVTEEVQKAAPAAKSAVHKMQPPPPSPGGGKRPEMLFSAAANHATHLNELPGSIQDLANKAQATKEELSQEPQHVTKNQLNNMLHTPSGDMKKLTKR